MLISIHALLAESDYIIGHAVNLHPISIHALLAESDPCRCRRAKARLIFLSTLSLRRATPRTAGSTSVGLYFYPRSPCGERPGADQRAGPRQHISIHALLAESDAGRAVPRCTPTYFYPRSPCGERPAPASSPSTAGTISIHALLAESDSKSAQNSGALLRI